MSQVLILGKGYTGTRLKKAIGASLITTRNPSSEDDIYFKLEDVDSWANLPSGKQVIWTFACVNSDLENKFFHFLNDRSTNVYIYSTSSVYLHEYDQQHIDEESPLDLQRPRTVAEEAYRSAGANILTLCGIYGPDRTPENWLKKGLIKNVNKHVNLVHVDDIVDITKALLLHNLEGARINLAPGLAHKWQDLAVLYKYSFPASAYNQKIINKVITSCFLTKFLPNNYKFKTPFDS